MNTSRHNVCEADLELATFAARHGNLDLYVDIGTDYSGPAGFPDRPYAFLIACAERAWWFVCPLSDEPFTDWLTIEQPPSTIRDHPDLPTLFPLLRAYNNLMS